MKLGAHANWVYRLLVFASIFVTAQQSVSGEGDTPAEAWYEYYRGRAANDYALVWEHAGRPIVVGQFFSYLIGDDKRSFCHVFTTLSDEVVAARRQDEVFWKPPTPDESKWIFTREAPNPSPNRRLRLIQMRNIARKFSAYTEEKTRGKRNLRFLPQPLHRYDEKAEDTDGGIFAYVVGNDPELLIVVECALTANETSWRYRFAQSTRSTTVATLGDTDVYRYEREGNPTSPTSSYFSKHGVETIPSTLDAVKQGE